MESRKIEHLNKWPKEIVTDKNKKKKTNKKKLRSGTLTLFIHTGWINYCANRRTVTAAVMMLNICGNMH